MKFMISSEAVEKALQTVSSVFSGSHLERKRLLIIWRGQPTLFCTKMKRNLNPQKTWKITQRICGKEAAAIPMLWKPFLMTGCGNHYFGVRESG